MRFENIQEKHKEQIIAIFNYYVKNSTAAFPSDEVPQEFFNVILNITKNYPAYALIDEKKVLGFGFLSAYKSFSTFNNTAMITYFLAPDSVGLGLGSKFLGELESAAVEKGIKNIIAEISSENEQSIKFHEKHGFKHCGELLDVGSKNDCVFSVVYMQKKI